MKHGQRVCLGCLPSGSCVTGLLLRSVTSSGFICCVVHVSLSSVVLAWMSHWWGWSKLKLGFQKWRDVILICNVAHHNTVSSHDFVNHAKTLWTSGNKSNQILKGLPRQSSTLSAHLKAAGRRSFKMQAPGWTFAILPLALSMLASDTGSSAGAQPSIEEEERGSRIPTLPLDTSNKDAVWMISGERKWKVNLPVMVVFTRVTRTKLCVSANHYRKPC